MYYANCEWYVDMGEHNKPLCERKSLRPAQCSECPVYIMSIENENAKLRELVHGLHWCNDKQWNKGACDDCPIRGDAMSRHGKVTWTVVLLAAFLCFELMVLSAETERAVTWHFHAALAITCATCTFLVWRL